MSQGEPVGPLEQSVGYALKVAAAALRHVLDDELRPQNLTVAQYSVLEQLGQRPGLSNADLARGAFVSRQSMNLVLRGLQDRGLVTRPDDVTTGRARPSELTAAGRRTLKAASAVVRAVEKTMVAALGSTEQHELHRFLTTCADALGGQRP